MRRQSWGPLSNNEVSRTIIHLLSQLLVWVKDRAKKRKKEKFTHHFSLDWYWDYILCTFPASHVTSISTIWVYTYRVPNRGGGA